MQMSLSADSPRPRPSEILSTHQVATIVLPTANGDIIRIRKGATPEPQHKEIYDLLGIGSEIMKPIKTRTPKDL